MPACRPMLCFAAALMAGVVLARQWPPAAWAPPVAGLALFCLFLAFFLKPVPPSFPPASVPEHYHAHILARPGPIGRRGYTLFLLLASLGFLLLGVWRQEAWKSGLAPDSLPAERWFDATLLAQAPARVHSDEDGLWRVPALLVEADGHGVPGIPVNLQGRRDAGFRRGDRLRSRVRRLPVFPKAYPGAFDYAFHLERDGRVATLEIAGRSRAGEALRVIPEDSPGVSVRILRLLDAIRGRTTALTLRHGGDSGPLLAAMLYGYRKDVDGEIRDAFRRVGIGHVLAISGLHVGLVVGLLWWLGGFVGWDRRWRALGCLVLAFVYLGLTGGQVAATRATLMAAIHLGGIVYGRKGDMMNSLGAAAFCITLLNPTAPFDVGFQLSFTAVVFIFLALHREPGSAGDPRTLPGRALRETWSLVRLSVATWVGLFPIIAIVFNQVNLIGLPINIVVIPLMSLVLAGGLLLPWFGAVPGASEFLTLPTRLLTRIAMLSDSLPASSFPAQAPSPAWTAVFYLFVALLMLRGVWRHGAVRRWWIAVALCGLLAGFVGIVAGMRPHAPPAEGRIAVLPGHGMGVLVAEAPSGEIGVFGNVRRGGLREAGWLHYLRRAGPAALIAFTSGDDDSYAAFSYHHPESAVARLRLSEKNAAGVFTPWLPAGSSNAIEYAYGRDGKGKVFWLSVRTGGKTATAIAGVSCDRFAHLLREGSAGGGAGVFVVSFSDRRPSLPEGVAAGSRVGVQGRMPLDMGTGFFRRGDYGVLLLGDELKGFDGREWRVPEE